MNSNRLDTLDQHLLPGYPWLQPRQRRAIAIALTGWAIDKTRISCPAVLSSIALLRANKIPAEPTCKKVTSLIEELDALYFSLQEHDDGQSQNREVRVAFERARAVAALGFAIKGNYLDAIYEALFASEYHEDIPNLISTELERDCSA